MQKVTESERVWEHYSGERSIKVQGTRRTEDGDRHAFKYLAIKVSGKWEAEGGSSSEKCKRRNYKHRTYGCNLVISTAKRWDLTANLVLLLN